MLLGAPFSVPLICIRAARSCLPKKVFDRSHSFRNAHMNAVSGYSYSIVKKLSHSMPIVSAATDNRRVASSRYSSNKCASFRRRSRFRYCSATGSGIVKDTELFRVSLRKLRKNARFALFLRCKTENDGE